ncbi:MAG: CoA transferase, partial [Henriciella sp.]|nr:CoA transferase [Henriciella sp.]
LEMTIPDGGEIALPAMPISVDGERPGLSLNPPEIGQHSTEVLKSLGLSENEIADLIDRGLVEAAAAKTPQAAE